MIAPANRVDAVDSNLDAGVDPWNGSSATAPALTLTYKFETSQPKDVDPFKDWQSFSDAYKTAIRKVLAEYASVINVKFVETKVKDADFSFGRVKLDDGFTGYGGFTYTYDIDASGKITNRNIDGYAVFDQAIKLSLGPSQTALILHEFGHAMTLKHSGNFEGSPAEQPFLPKPEENEQYTVMSYSAHPGTGKDSNHLMLYDIAALQARWGANMSTRTGDDTYRGPDGTALCIWDAGGKDAIDGAAYSSVAIDLHDGSFSSLGGKNNVSIAYGVLIENAAGSKGKDTLTGNDAANRLDGRGGNDTIKAGDGDDFIIGGAGADTIDGGAGVDTLRINANYSASALKAVGAGYTVTGEGLDHVTGVEIFVFNDKTVDVRASPSAEHLAPLTDFSLLLRDGAFPV